MKTKKMYQPLEMGVVELKMQGVIAGSAYGPGPTDPNARRFDFSDAKGEEDF